MSRKVVLFEKEDGTSPVEVFLKSLSAREQQKLIWGLKILEDGFPLKEPYFKKIVEHDGLWELRVTFGGNAFRIYFFELSAVLVIALCGFQKKNGKDQQKQIQQASQFMREEKRKANEVT